MKFGVVCYAAADTETRPSIPSLHSYYRKALPPASPLYSPMKPELQTYRATCTSTMSRGLLCWHSFSHVIISRMFIPTCQSDSYSSFKIWLTRYVTPFKKSSLPSLPWDISPLLLYHYTIIIAFTVMLV